MAAKRDIEIIRGDDYFHLLTFLDANRDPIDLTGFTGAAHVRKSPASTSAPEATFVVTIDDPESGQVLLELDSDQTNGLSPIKCNYYWDLELITGIDQTITPVRGKVIVVQDVTHTGS